MRIAATTLLIAAALLSWQPALSCTCDLKAPLEQLSVSDAVFAGKVIAVERVAGPLGTTVERAEVLVDEVWKGGITATRFVDVTVNPSCPFSLMPNVNYLIYAVRNPEGEAYTTHECMRTRPREHAEMDIALLGDSIVLDVDVTTWGLVKSLFDALRP